MTKWLECGCHAALAASTMLHASADTKAMIYYTIALIAVAQHRK